MPYLHPAAQELPFQAQSETSREAAVASEGRAAIQREQVYREIAQWSFASLGRTQKELAAVLHMERASVAPRCHELEKAGRIEKIPGVKRDGCAAYRIRK